MSKEIVIQASDLTKSYGQILALDHINFEVEKGQIFGFLGPNGAGKTTTIRMLTGLSKPTAGQASVLGFDVHSQIVKAKRYIGVVPEMSNLYDELSAMDNLLFMAQLYGLPRPQRRQRAQELLRTFGLYERQHDLFRTFSRGMKRALVIAAALIHNPEILFLDEPTVGLDVVAARSLRYLIANLRQQGITIFLTTHYLDEADLLCDRVAILLAGRIVQTDSPTALKAAAQEEPVVEFSFEGQIPALSEDLSNRLPGLKTVAVDHHRLRTYGATPTDIIANVLQFAQDKGLHIHSVNTIQPSLEDAFIKITGLSPIVMAVDKGGR